MWGFFELGVTHMLLGWDHLLFIGGVVVLAGDWRRAAKLITVFVVGHSITLILATMAGWHVNPGWVDVVIALSLVFVGVVALRGRPKRWTLFGLGVFGFGLIHGLGLASRLDEAGLPAEGLLSRVIAFNIGIEVGQVTAILVMVLLVSVIKSALGASRGMAVGRIGAVGLVLAGIVAGTYLTTQQLSESDKDDTAVAGGCSITDRAPSSPALGGHADKSFYGPGEEVPMADFGHSLEDGYVIVLYPADLPKTQVDELEGYVTGPDGEGVLAGSVADGDAVTASNTEQTLSCPAVEIDEISEFTTDWLESMPN